MRIVSFSSLVIIVCAGASAVHGDAARRPPTITLNQLAFRDRVYACWLGKSIGGTLGAPVEGRQETHSFTFFDPVPTQQTANDDLDLQMLWLKALEERGPNIDARVLGEYWLSYVPVDWNEYGVGKANMRDGIAPPLSGHFRNARWRDSNGAWIRSEIWACVAPGWPALAARYAFEDACVDHGISEGTYAEVFTASLESAAFVEPDRDKLLDVALSFVPADCGVARSVRAAREAKAKGLDLMAARQAVVEASKATGWFMAPQNVAFVVLGWLYGDGDFGRSICAAVNCGDDTDCTGATLGSLLGILGGTKGIPDNWRKPVGDQIQTVAIGGFRPPKNLPELAERTVRRAQVVLAWNGAEVRTRDDATAAVSAGGAELADAATARELWARSPYRIEYDLVWARVTLDMMGEPEIEAGSPRQIKVVVENRTPQPLDVAVTWRAPEGVAMNAPKAALHLPPSGGGPQECAVTLRADELRQAVLRCSAEIVAAGRTTVGVVPFSLVRRAGISKKDLALASLGAKATSDSELDREAGCTAKAIDGVLATPDDFEGKRWHSALTPHPHWIAVELPKAARIGRVIVHFADPAGHPVDFAGQVSGDGKAWQTIFEERAYGATLAYEKSFAPVEARHFRLVINRSASQVYVNAAQVSEVELLAE
jgi:ADP-ribosylglycohydrolase